MIGGTINSIIIGGHVGADPETRYTRDGAAVTSFSVATAERWLDEKTNEWQSHTTWHKVTVWGEKPAERLHATVHKGDLVTVQGYLRATSYVKDGETEARKAFEIVASVVLPQGGQAPAVSEEGRPETQNAGF